MSSVWVETPGCSRLRLCRNAPPPPLPSWLLSLRTSGPAGASLCSCGQRETIDAVGEAHYQRCLLTMTKPGATLCSPLTQAVRQHINPSAKYAQSHTGGAHCVQTHVHKHSRKYKSKENTATHHPGATTGMQHTGGAVGGVRGVPFLPLNAF